MTLKQVGELAGLNVGYLSQVENDKASPSLETLAALADALDVPIAWFLLDASARPRLVRASERPRRELLDGLGSMTQVDGGLAREIAIFEGEIPVGRRTGFHAHAGDEHHVVLAGRLRFTQGDAVVVAGAGDYVLLDGTLPHDAESIGDEPARLLLTLAPSSPATIDRYAPSVPGRGPGARRAGAVRIGARPARARSLPRGRRRSHRAPSPRQRDRRAPRAYGCPH
jgi:transcriptional regulator with XRE-family HTH domain